MSGKSLLDTFKGAIWETVPDAKGAPPPPPRNTPIPSPPVGAFPTGNLGPPSMAYGAPVVVDPAAVEKLEAKVQASMPESYRKFLDQYEAIKNDIPDESTRFRVALKTSGTSIADIASALQQITSVLDGTLADFLKKVDDTIAQKRGEAQQRLDADQKLIHDGEAQIAAIQQQLVDVRARVSTGQQGVQAEVDRLSTVRQGFQAAHAQVVGRLNAQKSALPNQKV